MFGFTERLDHKLDNRGTYVYLKMVFKGQAVMAATSDFHMVRPRRERQGKAPLQLLGEIGRGRSIVTNDLEINSASGQRQNKNE